MAVRVRKNVWSLPPGDTTLDWYRRAVAAMIARPISDPTSWRYQAAVHGSPPGVSPPPGASQFWDQCQHQSWFFLSWHRGYLAAFEAIVAKTIAGLGGPADWALPYWNYSQNLTQNPNARLLPPAFRNRTLPSGQPNHLWSRRRTVLIPGDYGIGPQVINLGALTVQAFTSPPGGTGFGGPPTGFNPGGGPNGALESTPHNRVHVQIGGFMGDPATAALDPIFWLHHCNIDRLWEVWRNQGPAFRNPTAPQWRTGVAFDLHDGAGQPFSFTSADMLDTTAVLHGYRYDTVPPAAEAAEVMEAELAPPAKPELVGANDAPTDLGQETRTVVHIEPKSLAALEIEGAPPQRAYLNLENITGAGAPGDFAVYVDLPDDSLGPQYVGALTTFGLARASRPDGPHGGSGLSQVFDITEVARRMGLDQGDVADLAVRFVREDVGPADEAAPEGLEDIAAEATPGDASVRVGRVSLYYA